VSDPAAVYVSMTAASIKEQRGQGTTGSEQRGQVFRDHILLFVKENWGSFTVIPKTLYNVPCAGYSYAPYIAGSLERISL
jgi:hypothetical protein